MWFFLLTIFLMSCTIRKVYYTNREDTPVYNTHVLASDDYTDIMGVLPKGYPVSVESINKDGYAKLWQINRYIHVDDLKKKGEKNSVFHFEYTYEKEELYSRLSFHTGIIMFSKDKIIMQEKMTDGHEFTPQQFRNTFGTFHRKNGKLTATFDKECVVTDNQLYALPVQGELYDVKRKIVCEITLKKDEVFVCYKDNDLSTKYLVKSKYNILGYSGYMRNH